MAPHGPLNLFSYFPEDSLLPDLGKCAFICSLLYWLLIHVSHYLGPKLYIAQASYVSVPVFKLSLLNRETRNRTARPFPTWTRLVLSMSCYTVSQEMTTRFWEHAGTSGILTASTHSARHLILRPPMTTVEWLSPSSRRCTIYLLKQTEVPSWIAVLLPGTQSNSPAKLSSSPLAVHTK